MKKLLSFCVFCGIISVSFGKKVSSCAVKVNDHCYEVALLPSNWCYHENNRSHSRPQRSIPSTESYAKILSESMNALSDDFNKLEKKLAKEMRDLSKRVLRGARRFESNIRDYDKNADHHKNRKNKCPNSFSYIDGWGSCYLFSTFNTSWYEARDYCAAFDADLLSLNFIKEHHLIAFILKNNKEYRNASGWWTSGTFISKTKQWMWTSEAEMRPFSFIKWAANEPNDVHETDLQCVMMYTIDGHLWRDQICTAKYNFVCEKQIE